MNEKQYISKAKNNQSESINIYKGFFFKIDKTSTEDINEIIQNWYCNYREHLQTNIVEN